MKRGLFYVAKTRHKKSQFTTLPHAEKSTALMVRKLKPESSASESKMHAEMGSCSESSFHRYLELSPELLLIISSFWNQRDMHRVNLALVGLYMHYNRILPSTVPRVSAAPILYQPMKTFLHRQFKVIPAEGKLLQYVIYADYEMAKTVIDQDPSLMFKPVNYLYRNGKSERISPLKYSFKVYDTYMWNFLFYKKIKNNAVYMKEFLKQAREQTEHINLEPLLVAYDEYEWQRRLWLKAKISDAELNIDWLKLGKWQREILPAHFLKEFSREGDAWNATSTFKARPMTIPGHCRVYDYSKKTWRPLTSIIEDKDWGVSFSLIRLGPFIQERARIAAWSQGFLCCDPDSRALRRLFYVRKRELTTQIALLTKSSSLNPELPQTKRFISDPLAVDVLAHQLRQK